jgi:hypothetical protein
MLGAATHAYAAGIAGQYTGRYQCQQWRPMELQISEQGGGRITGVFTFQLQAPGANGSFSYSMIGTYDAASGRVQLAPDRWQSRRPINVSMVGLDGVFDAATRRLRGRVTDFNCTSFEVVPPGIALTALPPPPAPPAPPEFRPTPTEVTGLNVSFEYRDSAMSDAPDTVRESEPIDDVIDWLRKQGFSCVDTGHVSWDPSGTKGSAFDVLTRRERYVIECNGNCRGVRYVPYANAQVMHFGTSMPVPTIEMKNVWLGEVKFNWIITRDNASQPPPDIYIHRWTASGFNARGACRAPKSDNKSGVRR